MSFLENISFSGRRRLPLLLQTEAAECGLACLGMVAAYHGLRYDLLTLRQKYPVSLKGASLSDLMRISTSMRLSSRPLRLEVEDLDELRLPCILHWGLDHFVVLKRVLRNAVILHDPSRGIIRVPMHVVSDMFTGVALELWPDLEFKPHVEVKRIKLSALMGNVRGIAVSFGQILLLALALECCALISPFYTQWVIDHVIASYDRDLLTTLALGFGLMLLVQQGIGFARSWMIMYMSTTMNIQWRANLFAHLLRLPMQYFEKRNLGDITSRFGSIDQIQRSLTISFLEGILDGLMAIATLVMMFMYSPVLGLVAVGAMGLYALSRLVWYRPLRNATEEQIVHAAKQQSYFLETIRGTKAIKLFQRQDERRASWLALLVDQINADVRSLRLLLVYRTLNGIIFGVENILIIWLGASLVLDGQFTIGMLMAFNSYKSQFDGRVSSLIDKFFEMKMLQLQGERLADIVLTEPEDTAAKGSTPVELTDASIETRELCFRYGDQDPLVLDKVSLKIEPGESVAIIGASGNGKTTLINVMLGLLTPTSGEVLLGGVSVRQIGIDAVRRAVGTVLQDDVLFAGSIADNISFFDPRADREWVEECARLAAIDADIRRMPMGYHTLVGDMGTVLSGGQKQRVLLARALYKRPRILFLDEATSHLDIGKEAEVNATIKALAITRVIVAHRPETIRSATRAISLVDGKVIPTPTVARGTPLELHA